MTYERDPKWVEMEREMAVKSAVEWIDGIVSIYERVVRDVNGYKSRFLDAVAGMKGRRSLFYGRPSDGGVGTPHPAEVLGWLVNATSAAGGSNLRLDLVGKHAVALTEAYRKVKVLAEAEVAAVEEARPKPYMLVAVKTVVPTLKSAREFSESPRTFDVVFLGTLGECYERAVRLSGGAMNCSTVGAVAPHVPVLITSGWTYYVKLVQALDDAKV